MPSFVVLGKAKAFIKLWIYEISDEKPKYFSRIRTFRGPGATVSKPKWTKTGNERRSQMSPQSMPQPFRKLFVYRQN